MNEGLEGFLLLFYGIASIFEISRAREYITLYVGKNKS